MSKSSICEKERKSITKMNKFQLHHKYKKVGYIVAITAFGFMIIKKIIEIDIIWLKPLLNNIMLAGLLIISISKEKIEDEFIESLRSQSYRLAFILSVIYSLIQPFINYSVAIIFNKSPKEFNSFSYFQVLIFMLIVQIAFFIQMKKMNK